LLDFVLKIADAFTTDTLISVFGVMRFCGWVLYL